MATIGPRRASTFWRRPAAIPARPDGAHKCLPTYLPGNRSVKQCSSCQYPSREDHDAEYLGLGRPPALPAVSEVESLLSVLERNRRTFAWKTVGLDETGCGRLRLPVR